MLSSNTGFLVLQKDIRNSNDWLRTALNKLGSTCWEGNALTGEYIKQDAPSLAFEQGTFCQFGPHVSLPIVNRNSVIGCWFNGEITNPEEIDAFTQLDVDEKDHAIYPIKLLVALNSNRHLGESGHENYAYLIKNRVLDHMRGKWDMVLAYFSQHPRFILSSHNSDLYVRFAFTEHSFLLMWSNNALFDQELREALGNDVQRVFWYNVTPLAYKQVLVIHPMFLIDKFRKWNRKFKTSGGRLMVVSVLEKYLQSIAVGDTVNFNILNDNQYPIRDFQAKSNPTEETEETEE